MTATNTVFTGNQAIGGAASGAGNQAALAAGGGILNFGTMTLTNLHAGGQRVDRRGDEWCHGSGNGMGGAIVDNEGALTVMASGIIGNEAEGGAGGGNGYGGGLYSGGVVSSAMLTLIDTLVTLNQADGGNGGGQGIGGGLYIAAGTASLSSQTKVILNFATMDPTVTSLVPIPDVSPPY